MVNIKKLKIKMLEKDLNVEQLAERLEVNKSTMYRKFTNKGENFTIKEATAMIGILNLNKEEVIEIFFADFMA